MTRNALRFTSFGRAFLHAALALATTTCGGLAFAQDATPQQQSQEPAAAPAPEAPQPAAEPSALPSQHPAVQSDPPAAESRVPAIAEDELKQQLVGKTLYLRGGYLDNSLHFDENGKLAGNSPQASYTLSLVVIDHVRAEKHRIELDGERYGLHFLGALPTEDQSQAVDKVKLTSKKKPLKITIEREVVVTPKKQKPEKAGKKSVPPAPAVAAVAAPESAPAPVAPAPDPELAVKSTTSQEHANKSLRDALDKIFAPGIDDRMIATLPDYWKFYYQAVADKSDYRPADKTILRQSQVDSKARLLSAFEPPSNEFAQNNGVAGLAMYHVVVGADGKPQEIAVGRPIGFGLDENAVDSIRKASFNPAIKDGKPVPVLVDLTVQFRIYSKRTAAAAAQPAKPDGGDPSVQTATLPGPYSAQLPH